MRDTSQPDTHNHEASPPAPPSLPPPYHARPGTYGGYYYGSAVYGASAPGSDGGLMAGLTVAQILRLIARKWWLLLLAVAFGLSLAALYLHQAVPVYRAEALVEMSIRRPRILAQPGAMIDDGFAGWRVEELLNTRLRKLQGHETRSLARTMLEEMKNIPADRRDEVQAAVGTVRMSRQRESHLVSVTAENPHPEVAALVATTYAQAAVKRSLQENRVESDQAVAWLQQQAAHQATLLEQAEEALLKFRADERMDQLEIEKRILEESVIRLSEELSLLDKRTVLANELMQLLDAVESEPEQFGNLPDNTPYHSEIMKAFTRWSEAAAQLSQLSARMTERHPLHIDQQRQVEMAREQVAQAITRSREMSKANIQLYEQQARSLRDRIGNQSDAATTIEARLAALRTNLSALERTRDSADASFKGLLTRIEEARLAADENTSVVHLIEQARAPGAPVFPRRNRVLVLGLAGGVLLGVLLSLGIHRLEDGIEGTEPIERQVGLKVIGLIPHEEIKDPAELAKVGLSKEYHPMVEAFANLRAMLESDTYRPHSSSILVTSTAPREGKTTIVSNLAISMARANLRTVLIGFDLRKPKLRPIFSIPDSQPSLAQALQADHPADFESLPFKVPEIPLWVISSRHGRESSASEVLGSQAIASLIDWAIKSYDRVIIDSPPYSLIGDALVLAGRVNGVLLVCRPSVTRMRALRHVARDFSEAGVRMLGVLVNDVEFKRSSYFSNYHYYDTHAYRYDHRYYSDEDTDTDSAVQTDPKQTADV